MRFALVLFVATFFTAGNARADEPTQPAQAQVSAAEEQGDMELLTPLTQAENDQVRGMCDCEMASVAARIQSCIAAYSQFLAGVKTGCIGRIQVNSCTGLFTYTSCCRK